MSGHETGRDVEELIAALRTAQTIARRICGGDDARARLMFDKLLAANLWDAVSTDDTTRPEVGQVYQNALRKIILDE